MEQMNRQSPKVVILGAGSLFFGRQAVWQMTHSSHLNQGTLALVDTDSERLEAMAAMAEKVIDHNDVPLALEASTDRRDVLEGADFVVLSFADQTVKYRGLDCEVSLKHGIRMCSGDTIGPGGIFRAMRELPEILAAAEDIRDICPETWVISYINPTTVHGIGLSKYAPDLKSFALCDSLHMPHVKEKYARMAGIIAEGEHLTADQDAAFDLRIAGVNHFTWLLKAELDDQDVVPEIVEALRQEANEESEQDLGAKRRFNATIGIILYDIYGYVPACVGHTKEYMRFWQGLGTLPEPVPPLSIWETEDRYALHEAMWRQVKAFANGETPIETFNSTFGPDHATDIIESMVGDLGKPFYINTLNRGAVPNMPDDAFLELLCDIDMSGPRPRAVGEMPVGLHGLQQQVLDTHELTADAIAACDRGLLRRAMLTDPLVSSIADADAIIEELLEAEREALPDCWYE
jgi:alpha-galactosidase